MRGPIAISSLRCFPSIKLPAPRLLIVETLGAVARAAPSALPTPTPPTPPPLILTPLSPLSLLRLALWPA
eukprot:scaffold152983_cov34-Tisochrysis_lutea.AAC.2